MQPHCFAAGSGQYLRPPDQLHPRIFEERVAVLEGGVAGLAVASGAAAITYAFENITRAGDHIVAAKTIYGGSYNLLAHTLPNYGVTTTFVDPSDLSYFEKAIQENTKACINRNTRKPEFQYYRHRSGIRNCSPSQNST
mgnify:CR=1 FL=1